MTLFRRVATQWRVIVLVAVVLGAILLALFLPVIPQDLAYHDFADKRRLLGVANSLNVLSNIPFLIVGLLGIVTLRSIELPTGSTPWLVFFVGVTLVSLGSAYYHWAPDNNSLLWDRLPMTIGFMGLVVALSQEFFARQPVHKLLGPAILVGISSVVYWHWTDDLRFYALVQFVPLIFVLLLVSLYDAPYTHTRLLGLALFCYVLAKVVEFYDAAIFQGLAGSVSGHTLKHLLAALACLFLVGFIKYRQPCSETRQV